MSFVARLLGVICLAVFTAAEAVAADVPSVPYHWRNVVVGGGGFAPEIIYSPAERGLAYLRTDMGGAYRWDEANQRWIPLEDGFAQGSYMGVESLAPDPKNRNIVYLAAGMDYREPAAILRSADRGATWSITPVPFKMGGNEDGRGLGERLAIDPNRTSTLLFGSRHDGLWRSDDSSKSWHKIKSFPWRGLRAPADSHSHGGIAFVVFDPHSRNIFAGVADPAGQHLYRSSDSGATWETVSDGPPASLLPVKAALDAKGILYIDYCSGIGPNGITKGAVWKLDTRSGRWTDITPNRGSEGGYMGLSLDRLHPGRIAVSTVDRWHPGDTIWISDDGGRDWRSLRERSSRDISAAPWLSSILPQAPFGHWIASLAFDPFDGGTLAYTTGATLYRTDDALQSKLLWKPWVSGIEQTAVITLTSPTAGAPLISGFGDIAGFVHDTLDLSPRRLFTNPFLPNTNNLDYAGLAPNIVVRSSSNYRPQPDAVSLAWSEDGGHNWAPLKAPPVRLKGTLQRIDNNGEAPINVTGDGKTFFVSGPVVLASSDRGRSWWTPAGLPQNVRAIADKANPNLVYAVDFTGSRIFISGDGGHSFAVAAGAGLPSDFSEDRPHWREAQFPLQATPGKAGDMWLLLNHRLYHSTNAGQSFATTTPADLSIKLFGLGAPAPGTSAPALYAFGARHGLVALWRSTDGGTTWARINDDAHQWGLRFRAISGDPKLFGRVYLATDGRGVLCGDPLR